MRIVQFRFKTFHEKTSIIYFVSIHKIRCWVFFELGTQTLRKPNFRLQKQVFTSKTWFRDVGAGEEAESFRSDFRLSRPRQGEVKTSLQR